VRVLRLRQVGDEARVFPVEVDENEGGQHQGADEPVAAEGAPRAEVVDKDAADDGAAAAPQPVVDALQHSLRRRPHLLRCVVGDVGAAGRPHRRVGDALHELERQNPPGVGQPRDVQESEYVAHEPQAQDLQIRNPIIVDQKFDFHGERIIKKTEPVREFTSFGYKVYRR